MPSKRLCFVWARRFQAVVNATNFYTNKTPTFVCRRISTCYYLYRSISLSHHCVIVTMTYTIFVVGDVHECWDKGSESAIRALNPDAVLFVGDYGDTSVNVVEQIVSFAEVERANGRNICAVMGNHEAIHYGIDPKDTQVGRAGALRIRELLQPYNPSERTFVLGPLALVGGRPCSWGGGEWAQFGHVYQDICGLRDLAHSAELTRQRVDEANLKTLAFLSHNGSAGLGSNPNDICGNDFDTKLSGDRGDPDLTNAIKHARNNGRQVLFVTHGHFHHRLQDRKNVRKMCVVDDFGTVHVNTAYVPRIRDVNGEQLHNFTRITLSSGESTVVQSVSVLWVTSNGKIHELENLYPVQCD